MAQRKCDYCPQTFKNERGFLIHIGRKHTRHPSTKNKEQEDRMKHRRNRRFNCHEEGCGAGFASMAELFKHKKKHTKENFDEVMKLLNKERSLATEMTMENARLKSEARHLIIESGQLKRKLLIIKLFIEEPNPYFDTSAAMTPAAEAPRK